MLNRLKHFFNYRRLIICQDQLAETVNIQNDQASEITLSTAQILKE